jgi:hypothetical protein
MVRTTPVFCGFQANDQPQMIRPRRLGVFTSIRSILDSTTWFVFNSLLGPAELSP